MRAGRAGAARDGARDPWERRRATRSACRGGRSGARRSPGTRRVGDGIDGNFYLVPPRKWWAEITNINTSTHTQISSSGQKKKKLRAIRLTKISLIKFVYFFRDAGPADGEEEAVSRQGSGSPADERWDANKKKLGDDGEG